ncbi:Pimeloyl-ACP methyl ester carboxylesterase [Geodermatophilus amargosae]|uniref:Pimeloyl-ACP methyl ester carboxylesterase n=1 Tax=Geodermatophilus amargosae TaxID=1296565 RepID=A0A1I6ZV94_9ACTN|nr:Pimeloyl-ACP methyl ester carboxylesterase [Geodermatophilus amargosae]
MRDRTPPDGDRDAPVRYGRRVSVITRNCVRVRGPESARPMVFAHGFGCDQTMWRAVAPDFAVDHRVVTFDHVGAGGSDLSAYDPERHGSLRGYADDLVEVVREMDLTDVVLVGHSVSSMIGVLAVLAAPERFGALVMVGPSPRYVDDGDYTGGFSRSDVAALLDSLDSNPAQWSAALAPLVAGPGNPEVAVELAESFCRTDPRVARDFARVTFLSDNRADLPAVRVPTLVLQCTDDAIAPEPVGRYVHSRVPGSVFTRLAATGHCPHLSAPEETAAAIRAFLRDN